MIKANKYFHTLRHLKFIQIRYQLFYLLRRKVGLEPRLNINAGKEKINNSKVSLSPSPIASTSFYSENTFQFLNLSHTFSENIDWNFAKYGKLWTYNLNYFEFLHQENLDSETGLILIKNYIQSAVQLQDGLEPFPIALRTIFWIKFLVKHQIQDSEIDAFLYAQVKLLSKKIEYHLLGNHLLENGFAFFYAAFYFSDNQFLKISNNILLPQLEEQILNDGAHFEVTPMYHQLMLYRILDCINLVDNNPNIFAGETLPGFRDKASKMCAWLREMTLESGETPRFNDSTSGIAPSPKSLSDYANSLEISKKKIQLSDSNYRVFRKENYELIVDVGGITPSYIPGHAHADALHFVLHKNGLPLIVDTGISTYEKNALRHTERSTAAHNTVQIADDNQSDVWGGFRVGQRAKASIISESLNSITAICTSYTKPKVQHERSFSVEKNTLTIIDKLSSPQEEAKSRFHLHPDIDFTLSENMVHGTFGKIIITGAHNIILEKYSYAEGYNKQREGIAIVAFFKQKLIVKIKD